MLIGGGSNHRMGLYDMLMIKDNHIAAAGGITAAVGRARGYLKGRGLALPIEVEASTLDDVREALACVEKQGADGLGPPVRPLCAQSRALALAGAEVSRVG